MLSFCDDDRDDDDSGGIQAVDQCRIGDFTDDLIATMMINVLVILLEVQRSSCRESVPESGGMVMMLRR
jgi:hypothetical protein